MADQPASGSATETSMAVEPTTAAETSIAVEPTTGAETPMADEPNSSWAGSAAENTSVSAEDTSNSLPEQEIPVCRHPKQ